MSGLTQTELVRSGPQILADNAPNEGSSYPGPAVAKAHSSSLPGGRGRSKTLQVPSAHQHIEARAGRRRLPALTSYASRECATVPDPAIAVLPHHDRLLPSRLPILPSRVLSPLSQPVLYSHVTFISPTVLPGRTPA